MAGQIVYEVLLNGEFLMSSLVHDSERALATVGLRALEQLRAGIAEGEESSGRAPWSTLVGGLGLGYTAQAVLDNERVRSLAVAEVLEPVIRWHERGLVPLGEQLSTDDRCEFWHTDFFERMAAPPQTRFDAILVDIDHSPTALLQGSPRDFYQRDGLRRLAEHLLPAGVFALWSADPLDDAFMTELEAAFDQVESTEIVFDNPLLDFDDRNLIYVGMTAQ